MAGVGHGWHAAAVKYGHASEAIEQEQWLERAARRAIQAQGGHPQFSSTH